MSSRSLFHNRLPLPILVFMLLLMLFFFSSRLLTDEIEITIPVRAKEAPARVLEQYAAATVLGGSVRIDKPTLAHKLFAPAEGFLYDPIYALWMFGALLIGYLYFRKMTTEEPFTAQTLKGMRALALITFVLLVATSTRHYWIHREIEALTGGHYTPRIPSMFLMPEFWLLMALLRGVHIFRKGYQLSLDQQYTV
jgi:hypothetical protein